MLAFDMPGCSTRQPDTHRRNELRSDKILSPTSCRRISRMPIRFVEADIVGARAPPSGCARRAMEVSAGIDSRPRRARLLRPCLAILPLKMISAIKML